MSATSFTNVHGDLFDFAGTHAIAHGVNCQGLMGAGIAAQMASRFPRMKRHYIAQCVAGTLVPGGMLPWVDLTLDDPIHVLNCASQNQPGPDAQLGWLLSSLRLAADYCNAVEWPLAVPEIGCHIGNLDRGEVFNVFSAIGSLVDLTVVTYSK